MAEEKGDTSSWKLEQIGLVVRDMGQGRGAVFASGLRPVHSQDPAPGGQGMGQRQRNPSRRQGHGHHDGKRRVGALPAGSGDSPHRDYLDSIGEGIQHVLFRVDNLQKEIDRLTRLGWTVLLRPSFGDVEGLGGSPTSTSTPPVSLSSCLNCRKEVRHGGKPERRGMVHRPTRREAHIRLVWALPASSGFERPCTIGWPSPAG